MEEKVKQIKSAKKLVKKNAYRDVAEEFYSHFKLKLFWHQINVKDSLWVSRRLTIILSYYYFLQVKSVQSSSPLPYRQKLDINSKSEKL